MNEEGKTNNPAKIDCKVLFITRKWPPAVGGMETYSYELVKDLSTLTNLTVRVLPGRTDGKPPSLFQLAMFMISSVFFLWRNRKTFKIVQFGDFVLFPLAWWHSICAPSSIRIIMVHGLDLIFGNRSHWKGNLYRRFVSWAQKHKHVIHQIIANSKHTATLCKNFGFSQVTAIPLGKRIETHERISPLERFPEKKYIVFMGRLIRRKGARWFAENVMSKLPEDVSLHVIGKAWDPEETKALTQNRRITLHGYLPSNKLKELCRGARAMILPNIISEGETDVEGFGLVALDGAAFGLPCIVSDIEGLKDAVIHGKTGFLIQAGNADAWLSQLNIVLNWDLKKRREFEKESFEYLKTRFSWSRVAKETVEVYKRFL